MDTGNATPELLTTKPDKLFGENYRTATWGYDRRLAPWEVVLIARAIDSQWRESRRR